MVGRREEGDAGASCAGDASPRASSPTQAPKTRRRQRAREAPRPVSRCPADRRPIMRRHNTWRPATEPSPAPWSPTTRARPVAVSLGPGLDRAPGVGLAARQARSRRTGRQSGDAGHRGLRNAYPAAARRQLLRLPWRGGDGRAAARYARRPLQGSETGPIVTRQAGASPLLKVVQHADGYPAMPRGRPKLAQADIDALAEWVARRRVAGAERRPRPRRSRRTSAPSPPSIVPSGRSGRCKPRRRRRCATPPGRATDIDRFVLARLEPRASRRWPTPTSARCSAG